MQPNEQEEESTNLIAQSVVGTIGFVLILVLFGIILGNAQSSGSPEVAIEEIEQLTEFADENGPVGADSSVLELRLEDDLDCVQAYEFPFSGDQPPTSNLQIDTHFLFFERSDLFYNGPIVIGTSDVAGRFVDASGRPVEVHFATRFDGVWTTTRIITCNPNNEFGPAVVAAPSTTAAATTTPPGNAREGDAEDSTTAAPPTSATIAPTTSATSSSTTTTTIANGRPVPDVVGLEVNDAILVIFDWDLAIVRENEASDEIPAGFVIRTDPDAGTTVAPQTPVTLVVSTGPE